MEVANVFWLPINLFLKFDDSKFKRFELTP